MALSWHAGLVKPPKHPEFVGWLTSSEVARACDVSVATVRQWTKLGKLRASKVGARLLYDPRDVTRAVEEATVRVAPLG